MPRPPVDNKLLPHKDQLGKIPDQDIAARAKVSRSAVVNYRKRLGIPAYEGYKFQSGAPAAKAPPAPAPAPVKADKGGKPAAKAVVAAAPPPAAAKALVAAKPVVAAKAAVVVAPAAASPAGTDFRGRKSKLDPYLPLLGVESDATIAAKANVTVENVRAYRVRRGINSASQAAPAAAPKVAPPAARKPAAPAVAPKAAPPAAAPVVAAKAASPAPAPAAPPKGPPAPPAAAPKAAPPAAPKAAPPAAPVAAAPPAVVAPKPAGRTAWLVTLDEKGESRSYAVLANDIAEAAVSAVAGAKGRGTVRAVSKIADLL